MTKSLFVCLAASLLAVTCFAADDDPGDPSIIPHFGKKKSEDGTDTKEKKGPKPLISSSVKASAKPLPRIWIGLTGSITPLKLLTANTNPFTDSSYNVYSATKSGGFVGGGLTLNARIVKDFWLSVGAIYRVTGYDWTLAVYDTNSDVFTERSRATLVDFPVLVRYSGRKWNLSKHTFYEVGGTYRDGLSRKTTTYWTDYTNESLGSGIASPNTVYNKKSYGATVGAGLIARDDFGIIVSPEVRYTRWMDNTFNNVTGGQNLFGTQRNQLEVTLSFGF